MSNIPPHNGVAASTTSRKLVSNPYAKKGAAAVDSTRPPSSHQQHENNSTNAAAAASDRLGLPSRDVPRTFSQAFGSSSSSSPPTTTTNDNAAHAASTSNANAAAAADASLTDRDHHRLLAQPHVLYVSTKQRGNGVLQFVRNVPFQYSRMVPDYIVGGKHTRCVLFLSCKYHGLYPNYIFRRISELGHDFIVRILLVLVDVKDNANVLLFLNTLCVTHNLTLLLAWSEEEAARYLETLQVLDPHANVSLIQKKTSTNFVDQVADVLHVAKLNTTDAASVLGQLGSWRSLCQAAPDELALVPGLGPTKISKLHAALHQPFGGKQKRRRTAAYDAPEPPPVINHDASATKDDKTEFQ